MARLKLWDKISKYESFIRSGVNKHYRKLPDAVRLVYSFEDVCQDALLSVRLGLDEYDSDRGASIKSYIFYLVERYCAHLIKAQYAAKRTALLVPLEDLKLMLGKGERATSIIQVKEAINKVRAMHLDASPALIDFIADNLYFRPEDCSKLRIDRTAIDYKYVRNIYTKGLRKVALTKAEILQNRTKEFRALVARHKVKIDDYRLALRAEL